MPDETRYCTLSGNVPNGGIPPGRTFASVAGPPLEPNLGRYVHSPPPAYSAPQNDVTGRGLHSYFPTLHPGPPPPAPRTPHVAAPSPPASNLSRYKTPGQYIDGNILPGDGWTYITPSELTTIYFVMDGTRPCDAPDGYYPHEFNFTKHKAPTVMTVKDLMKGLGAPEGDNVGITEMEELGDNRFTAGATIMQGSEEAKKTLWQVGWTQRKSEAAPIWILVKR